jgi:hypothetical protein
METFIGWLKSETLNEDNSRYSVEVNFRTRAKEILENYARICLGYVSAALKASDYHVKQVFEEEPIRILISTRNWDDGEWIGVVTWNPHKNCFILSKGFYNKDRKTVSIQSSHECKGDNASEIASDAKNLMHNLKNVRDRHIEKLKKVPLKRGPKS